jgi:hypothetical protein
VFNGATVGFLLKHECQMKRVGEVELGSVEKLVSEMVGIGAVCRVERRGTCLPESLRKQLLIRSGWKVLWEATVVPSVAPSSVKTTAHLHQIRSQASLGARSLAVWWHERPDGTWGPA